MVPAPPVLVAVLRAHCRCHGTAPDGRLFRGTRGGLLSESAALAGIGAMPDTIEDRAVVIRMRRRAPGETVAPFRHRRDRPALTAVATQLEKGSASTWPSSNAPISS